MNVNIVVGDSIVSVDGRSFRVDLTGLLLPEISAVHWYDTHGEIEFKPAEDGTREPNTTFEDMAPYQPVLDLWSIEAMKPPPPPPGPPVQDPIKVARAANFLADPNRQALITQLQTATPAQITAFITNNVTDLASARAMLVKFALVLALVANR
jgi:hypothetical protein